MPATKLSRRIKDSILRNYYTFRIETAQEPNRLILRAKPYQVLLILSHMRSGSSLLTHILTSHNQIAGYGETHLNYSAESDFKALLYKVYWAVRGFRMDHTYILDKILHNQKLQDNQILHASYIKIIFLIRQPTATIASLLKLKPHWDESAAVHYYCDRLATLETYAKRINDQQKCMCLTYKELLEQTPQTLAAMQRFLELAEPLSEEYQLNRRTGMRGIGDSSDRIKAGRIIRTSQASETRLTEQLAGLSTTAFEHCKQTLLQHCQTRS
ncbi:MAG: sulfotransferase domain-containing protein [Cyanobacteria bacterium P01_H01_bin.121]